MAVILPIITEFNSKGVDSAMGSLKKLATSQVGAVLSTGALAAGLKAASQAAIEDAKSQKLLAVALRDNAGATLEQMTAGEAFIQQTQDQTNVLDDKLRPAMASLVRYTKNMTTAQSLLGTAMDISAGTGKDLGSVATALGKAYGGNFTALKRLGIPIDDSIIKSKDFAAAWRDLNDAFSGSQDAITKAEGSVGDFRVAWEDLKEQVGGVANTIGAPLVSFGSAIAEMFAYAGEQARYLIGAETKLIDTTKKLADAARFRSFEEKMNVKWTQIKAEADKKAADAAAKAAAAARELARENKVRLSDALATAKKRLEEITAASDAYDQSIRGVIYGTVSLSDAVTMANQANEDYTAAIRERADAYAELNAVQAKGVDVRTGSRTAQDAKDYADAIERVAKAETAVTNAQTARKDYTTIFRDQITAAKEFAGNLQQLVGKGLQDIGLQQLLNLGPVAGNQVAKDMLAGTAGLTVSDLNLTDLQAAATGLGGAAAGSMYGAQIAAAQTTVGQVQQAQTFNITVTSADPDKVVAALVAWSKKNGKLPSTVKVS